MLVLCHAVLVVCGSFLFTANLFVPLYGLIYVFNCLNLFYFIDLILRLQTYIERENWYLEQKLCSLSNKHKEENKSNHDGFRFDLVLWGSKQQMNSLLSNS